MADIRRSGESRITAQTIKFVFLRGKMADHVAKKRPGICIVVARLYLVYTVQFYILLSRSNGPN
jgi:hypothetical protein